MQLGCWITLNENDIENGKQCKRDMHFIQWCECCNTRNIHIPKMIFSWWRKYYQNQLRFWQFVLWKTHWLVIIVHALPASVKYWYCIVLHCIVLCFSCFVQVQVGFLSFLYSEVQRECHGAGQHVRPSDERLHSEARRESPAGLIGILYSQSGKINIHSIRTCLPLPLPLPVNQPPPLISSAFASCQSPPPFPSYPLPLLSVNHPLPSPPIHCLCFLSITPSLPLLSLAFASCQSPPPFPSLPLLSLAFASYSSLCLLFTLKIVVKCVKIAT